MQLLQLQETNLQRYCGCGLQILRLGLAEEHILLGFFFIFFNFFFIFFFFIYLFFFLYSHNKINLNRSLALMSMVGYILGLGDRHLSNIMFERNTGKVLHIDFGDCFEVLRHRDKYPEKIPFRLTR